jgi:hypothetical protein
LIRDRSASKAIGFAALLDECVDELTNDGEGPKDEEIVSAVSAAACRSLPSSKELRVARNRLSALARAMASGERERSEFDADPTSVALATVAHHEAGHTVVALALGLELKSAEASPDEGLVKQHPSESMPPYLVSSGIKARWRSLIMTAAGNIAEALHAGREPGNEGWSARHAASECKKNDPEWEKYAPEVFRLSVLDCGVEHKVDLPCDAFLEIELATQIVRAGRVRRALAPWTASGSGRARIRPYGIDPHRISRSQEVLRIIGRAEEVAEGIVRERWRSVEAIARELVRCSPKPVASARLRSVAGLTTYFPHLS